MEKKFQSIFSLSILVIYCLLPRTLPAEQLTISLSDAIFRTLKSNPGIQIQKEKIVQGEGSLQTASGQFDWVGIASVSREQERSHLTNAQEEQLNLLPIAVRPGITDNTREQTTAYSIGARKQLRSGLVISPTISTLDIEDLSAGVASLNRSDLNVDIIIPLLRGLGGKNTGAEEMAAISNLDTARLLSRHNISGKILATATAYWNCLASIKNLKVLEDSEKRAAEIFTLVKSLIKAGELEPAILPQAQAQLYQRKADLRGSRRTAYEARQALAVAMGLTPSEMAGAPMPEGPFPSVVEDPAMDEGLTQRYIDEALASRADYQAARSSIQTQEILLQKAGNEMKPRLDFNLRMGLGGLNERNDSSRYLRSLYHDTTGPNVFGALSLEFPISNEAARGEFIRRRSLAREAKLNATQLSNSIASDVLVALERLSAALNQHWLARSSAEAYQEATGYEKYKVQVGESSLSDLVDMEDRYFEARVAQVDALRKYSAALAELRFVMGGLLIEEEDNLRLKVKGLLTLPVPKGQKIAE